MSSSDAQQLLDKATGYANSWAGKAESLLKELGGINSGSKAVMYGTFANQIPPLVTENLDEIKAAMNAVSSHSLVSETQFSYPESPPSPILDAAPVLDAIGVAALIPAFSVAAPLVEIPPEPTITIPNAPGNAPTFTAPQIPDRPAINLPTAPVLADISLPEPPTVEIPQFSAYLTTGIEPGEVTADFDYSERADEFDPDILNALMANVLADMASGTGIAPEIEEQIWQRDRERESRTLEETRSGIQQDFAARGFPFPPGAMLSALRRANDKTLEVIQSASRDVAIKRADMAVEARKSAMQQAREIAALLLEMHNRFKDRLLQASKYIADVAIARYNAKVDRFRVDMERFRAESDVYRSMIEAAVQKANLYRTQIDAARAKGEVQAQRIELYRSQLGAIDAMVGIYRAQMEAASVASNIERNRLEAYRAEVDAYVARTNAEESKMRLFDSRVRSQETKVNLFEAQVSAYEKQASAARVKADLLIESGRMALEVNRAKVDTYRAKIEAYNAELRAKQTTAELHIKTSEAQIEQLRAKVSAAASYASAVSENNRVKIAEATERTNSMLVSERMWFESMTTDKELKYKSMTTAAEIYSHLISSALSSINAVATVEG